MKIQGQNEEMLLAACEQFLSKSDDEIQQVIEVNLLVNDGYDDDAPGGPWDIGRSPESDHGLDDSGGRFSFCNDIASDGIWPNILNLSFRW